MTAYADLPMDLADASLVILAEHLGHGRILSTDKRDFHTYRWKNRHHATWTSLRIMAPILPGRYADESNACLMAVANG
jgi:hypothetical protein